MVTTRVRILPGLPPYGPRAAPFPAGGGLEFREGVVVEFTDNEGGKWVGNFGPGFGGCTTIFDTFGADRPVVVANGRVYIVDAPSRRVIEDFGATIDWSLELRERGRLIFADGFGFMAHGRDGVIWESGRVSWDGMRDLTVDGGRVRGSAYSPFDDDYKEFDLDLETGKFTGGSYVGPP